MLSRVALVRTDVSEKRSASFIRMTRIGELGTTLGATNNRRTLRRNTSVLTRATRRDIAEDTILENGSSFRNVVFFSMYGCETWSLTVREEHKLRVFENGVEENIWTKEG
jgi:hypothetical protein